MSTYHHNFLELLNIDRAIFHIRLSFAKVFHSLNYFEYVPKDNLELISTSKICLLMLNWPENERDSLTKMNILSTIERRTIDELDFRDTSR